MQSLGRTAIYTIGTVALSNVLGIALGLLLTSALKSCAMRFLPTTIN